MDKCRHGQIAKLLRETVVMLCKNGVCFERQLRVQGLIGVTVDDGTVFLVHMNECVSADGCSSSDKPEISQSSLDVSASSRQSCGDRENEQLQAEEYRWPKMSEASASQYSYVKQEREPSRTVNDVYVESQNAADVPAAASASLLSVQVNDFGDRVDHDDVVCIESSSDQTSVGSNRVKHEPPEIWNPYSVTFTADEQEYTLSDYSTRELSDASGSHTPVHGDTSQYSESLHNKTAYGGMGVTHYLDTSQKLLQSIPNQLARMGSGQRKMVRHSVPRPSWHMPQIPDVQPQFATSHEPTSFQQMPVNTLPPVRKRGRPPKTTQMTRIATSAEFDSDSKWEMVKLTKFACKLCGQTFNHQPNLFRHQITAHGRQKKIRGRPPPSMS